VLVLCDASQENTRPGPALHVARDCAAAVYAGVMILGAVGSGKTPRVTHPYRYQPLLS
jgi:hypothetical protein